MIRQGRVARVVDTKAPPRKKHTEKQYYEYLKGKSVILIGPASYYEEPELDHDVVVRMNHGFNLLRRTNVLYINTLFGGKTDRIGELCEALSGGLDIDWLIAKNGRVYDWGFDVPTVVMNNHYGQRIKRSIPRPGKAINLGTIAIKHLLDADISKLTIRGIDFYQSVYYDGYHSEVKTLKQLQEHVKRTHNITGQVEYLKNLLRGDARVDIDQTLRKILHG